MRISAFPCGFYERLVFFDPPEAGERMRGWLPSGRLRRQGTGDLGARMADAFARAFARGASRVVLVGSDAPGLTRGDVQAAFAALGAHDVVLGPSEDGGYYLVGLLAPRPALFDGMAWSTRSVRERTLERAASLGLSVALLRPLRDVDTLLDLRAEWERLEAPLARQPELRLRLVDAVEMVAGKLDGYALRVPTSTVSVIDLTAELETPTTTEELRHAYRDAAAGPLKGILQAVDEPLVSIDFKGDPHSSSVDLPFTLVLGKEKNNFVKIVAWYDNEWGYAVRTADLAALMAKSL